MSFATDLQTKVKGQLNTLDSELTKYPTLNKIQAQTGVPKSYGVIGFASLYFLLVAVNPAGFGQFLSNFASLVIPGYYSLQALESKTSSDDTQFLTYWVVYAGFSVLEFWSNTLLYWIPFYWVLKTVLFLYLGLPQFSGAKLVYLKFLRPFSVKFLGITGAPVQTPGKVPQAPVQTHAQAPVPVQIPTQAPVQAQAPVQTQAPLQPKAPLQTHEQIPIQAPTQTHANIPVQPTTAGLKERVADTTLPLNTGTSTSMNY